MTRDRIQHALDIIYEKVFNLGQADLYPGLVSGPYLQHNPLFPNGLDAIVGYIKQAGRIPCEVKRVAIDGDDFLGRFQRMFDLINVVRQDDKRLNISGGNKCQRTRRSSLLLLGLP